MAQRVLDSKDEASILREKVNANFVELYSKLSVGEAPTMNAFSVIKLAIARGQSTSLLVWGDSTGNDSTTPREWPWLLADRIATENPSYTVLVMQWNDAGPAWNSAVTIQTGTAGGSAPVFTIWNYSIPGVATHYSLGDRWPVIRSLSVDGVIINHGHNHVTGQVLEIVRGEFFAAVETYRLYNPAVPISAIIQNPRQDSTLMDTAVEAWKDVAQYRDIGLINVHDEFVARGKPTTLYVDADTIHPSALAQSDIVIVKVWEHYKTAQPRTQHPMPSLFSTPAGEANLIPNGHFALYPTAPGLPTGWTAGGTGTLTADKELTIIADNRLGYSVKLTSITNASRLDYSLPVAAYTALRGQRVTLAAKRYAPTGAGSNVGRMQLISNSATMGNPFMTSRAYTTLQQGFVWWVISGFPVPADATSLVVRLFHDSTAGAPNASPAYWDQACLVPGIVPRAAR